MTGTIADLMAEDATGDSRPRSSGEGSSHEDPDIIEISPSRHQKQKRKRIHQVVSCDVVEIDEDNDLDAVEIIGTGNSNYKKQSVEYYEASHQSIKVVSRDVVEIDEDNDLNAIEIISTGNSDYKKQSVGCYEASHQSIKEALPYTAIGMGAYFSSKIGAPQIILSNSEPIAKSLCKNEPEMIVEDEIDMRFKSFKQFDIVQDHSDHTFSRLDIMASNVSGKEREIIPPTKNLINRIHYEWKILKEALPETIYVRAYEGRMDLLSAVIIGAAGTPYHDGLFFFDIYFHPNYPNSAPYVWYHSIGLNLNVHFGSAGNVCLSLLSGFGSGCETWCPSKSTILQVLVSLQGLVLTANPLFNDSITDTFSRGRELPNSDMQMKSRALNEKYFLASCRTMLYSVWKPPKNFEDLISGHFRKRGRAILTACLAYLDGAQVGCVDEQGIQDVVKGDSSSNSDFRISLGCLIRHMIREFTAKGADCNDLMQKVNAISTAAAIARAKKPDWHVDDHHLQNEKLKDAIDGVPMYKLPPMSEDDDYE